MHMKTLKSNEISHGRELVHAQEEGYKRSRILGEQVSGSACHDPLPRHSFPAPGPCPRSPLRPAPGLTPTRRPSPAATATSHRRPSHHHCCHHATITRISPSSSAPCRRPTMAPDPAFLTAPAPLDPNRHPALYTIPGPCSEPLPHQPRSSYNSTAPLISIH